jgi:anthraniloyl-CoA monooxygenase
MMEAAMRVAILGGGPAGLYFSALLKQARPDTDITVYERNRPDDTFGFGVVFSDATLDIFERYDLPSYQAIIANFAYWDDIEIRFKDSVRRVGGNGFCGCSRRTLLLLLQRRATDLGVKLTFQTDISDLSQFADADLIVASDGINSFVRETNKAHFGTEIDMRPNRFTWMGSTRPLDAFTFSFRETEFGVFIAHAYQYQQGASTWIFETDDATFHRAGLDGMDEAQSARFLEGIFAADLGGHGLITNRSLWRRFPMIRNKRATWLLAEGAPGNIVLLGDAKSTAHFSIGSGTKLAMEDAIALFECVTHADDVPAALAAFERDRREHVERIQHAADVSLVWFEHVRRFWHMAPTQFAFGLMTRSKSITYDNLKLRAPDFVAEIDAAFAVQTQAAGLTPVTAPPMFQPFKLRDMTLANRVVMSPMCMYSAKDGVPSDWHLVHYASRAMGGAGLIYTEMTDISAEARISLGCAGLYTDAQQGAWTRIVEFVHAHSRAKMCLQLGHAGRKAATKLMWDGMDRPLDTGAWPIMAPSALPYYPESQTPREMTRADMDAVRDDFVAATKRAAAAGFDMLELHCAHGYLLGSFISPLTNVRHDDYGGDLDARLRYPLEVFAAMRAAWPADRPMSVRISATDWADGGITAEDSVEIARAFTRHGCDLIDVSTGQTVADAEPVYGRMFQTPFSDQIRNDCGIATMCVGNITNADQVNTILAAGRADLVALGRSHLADPYFTLHAAALYGAPLPVAAPQYGPGVAQLYRTAAAGQTELVGMKLATRPKTHNPG